MNALSDIAIDGPDANSMQTGEVEPSPVHGSFTIERLSVPRYSSPCAATTAPCLRRASSGESV